MHKPALVILVAAACAAALGSFAVWAQAIDGDPCRTACYQQKAACVSECGAHSNPVECEAACHEQLDECLIQCG
jgi:hypothetical protein